MEKKSLILVAYDISSPALERQVVKLLTGMGVRYQYSVFICHLTDKQKADLTSALKKIYNGKGKPADGQCATFRISAIPLCASCAEARLEVGADFAWPTGSLVV